tara:strand:- start:5009 stop:5443 length:435 start_codon:yes stop_codon:yes gene_type:complete
MKAFYFAYGLNLEEHSMVDLYPSARFYKFAALRGFKLIFSNNGSGDGFCSLVPGSFNDTLEGVLYTLDHWDLEDPFEGCSMSIMDIMCDNGEFVTAHVYYTRNKDFVSPNQDYLMRVHKKYQDYGFNVKAIENALDVSNYREVS